MDKLPAEQLELVDKWLRSVLWEGALPGVDAPPNFEIHRSKGRLVFEGGDVKMLQGVREIFELIDAPESDEPTPEAGKIIFIGRHLRGVDFETSFRSVVK